MSPRSGMLVLSASSSPPQSGRLPPLAATHSRLARHFYATLVRYAHSGGRQKHRNDRRTRFTTRTGGGPPLAPLGHRLGLRRRRWPWTTGITLPPFSRLLLSWRLDFGCRFAIARFGRTMMAGGLLLIAKRHWRSATAPVHGGVAIRAPPLRGQPLKLPARHGRDDVTGWP